MRSKLFAIAWLLFFVAFCFSANNTPWNGIEWDSDSPDIDQPFGNAYKELYSIRRGVELRINKEHVSFDTSSVGGEHSQGSARAFFQDAAPTTQIDGTAWVAGDTGSLWFDTDSTPDNLVYVLTNHASTGTWTLLSVSLSGEAFTWTANHVWDDGTTDSPSITLKDATNETCAIVKLDNGDTTITIPADTDFEIVAGNLAVGNGSPGTAAMDGEDMYVTGAFEVDGVATLDGNVTVGGTLNIQGTIALVGTLDEDNMSTNSAVNLATQQSIKAYADTKEATLVTQATASIFGSRTFKDSGGSNNLNHTFIYRAGSDGFLTVSLNDAFAEFVIRTDSSSSPSTVVAATESNANQVNGVTVPILKDDYVKVTRVIGDKDALISWVPIGTGSLVKQ